MFVYKSCYGNIKVSHWEMAEPFIKSVKIAYIKTLRLIVVLLDKATKYYF